MSMSNERVSQVEKEGRKLVATDGDEGVQETTRTESSKKGRSTSTRKKSGTNSGNQQEAEVSPNETIQSSQNTEANGNESSRGSGKRNAPTKKSYGSIHN